MQHPNRCCIFCVVRPCDNCTQVWNQPTLAGVCIRRRGNNTNNNIEIMDKSFIYINRSSFENNGITTVELLLEGFASTKDRVDEIMKSDQPMMLIPVTYKIGQAVDMIYWAGYVKAIINHTTDNGKTMDVQVMYIPPSNKDVIVISPSGVSSYLVIRNNKGWTQEPIESLQFAFSVAKYESDKPDTLSVNIVPVDSHRNAIGDEYEFKKYNSKDKCLTCYRSTMPLRY